VVDNHWHERRLPSTCRKGHPWGSSELIVSSEACDCPIVSADSGRDHLVVHCRQQGCSETWHGDEDTVISALKDRRSSATSDRASAQALGALDAAWTLLTQAHEYQMGLLRPAHPSAARIAALQTWITACVTAIDKAQRSESLIVRSDEMAHITEIAARMAPVVDAFHVYASTLKRFRSSDLAAMGSLHPEPLAAAVDEERALVGCRATLRTSLRQLTEALHADD
jgi:hypothetical protein